MSKYFKVTFNTLVGNQRTVTIHAKDSESAKKVCIDAYGVVVKDIIRVEEEK